MSPISYEFSTEASLRSAFEAVATAKGVRAWWAANSEVGESTGKTSELRFDKDGRIVVMSFVTADLDPSGLVRWKCTGNANPAWVGSTLTWTIRDAGDARKVRFIHDGFAMGGPPYDMTVEGWKDFMASFERYLATGKGTPSK